MLARLLCQGASRQLHSTTVSRRREHALPRNAAAWADECEEDTGVTDGPTGGFDKKARVLTLTLPGAVCRFAAVCAFLVAFMAARLRLQGGGAPEWYGPTNPAANADRLSTRVLSFAYIDWLHFKLLLWPSTFCPDWRNSVHAM